MPVAAKQAGYCTVYLIMSVFHPRRSWIFPHQFPNNLLSPAIPPGPRYSRQFGEWLAIQCHIYLHSLFKDNGDDLPNALLLFRSTVKWKRLLKDIRSKIRETLSSRSLVVWPPTIELQRPISNTRPLPLSSCSSAFLITLAS